LNIFNTFKPVSTAEQIYVELKKMLFDYQIVPGQKLQCQDLAEKFKVSRTPVKDALNMLGKEGYIGLKHNKGFYVVEIGLKEAEELYEIRQAIETLAVRKAIEKSDRESLKLLRQAMETYSEDVRGRMLSRKRLILDANFHLKIAEIARNESLVEILRMIFSKIYLKHRVENLSPQRSVMADKEHMEIYQAIYSKELSVAMKKMERHIVLGRKNVLGALIEQRGLGLNRKP